MKLKLFQHWGRGRRLALAAMLLAGVSIAVLAGACCSLPKQALAERLMDLEKNAAMGELLRRPMRADLGAGERDFELLYQHVPAQNPGARLPVVLIHGTPSTLYSWTELIYGVPGSGQPGLSEFHDVYALEVIGHGVAPGDAGPYGFERCARFIVAALSSLGLERVHLVGSSYGGEFAWRAALNAPHRIASLALLDSSGYRRREGDWLPEEVVMRNNPLARYGWLLNSKQRIQTALALHFGELPPDRVDEFFLVCENAHNWEAMIDLVCDENGSREAEIRNLKAPTLILWGEDDCAYALDVYGRRFLQDIEQAELVVLPETGHYPHEQRPAQVIQILLSFFGTRP